MLYICHTTTDFAVDFHHVRYSVTCSTEDGCLGFNIVCTFPVDHGGTYFWNDLHLSLKHELCLLARELEMNCRHGQLLQVFHETKLLRQLLINKCLHNVLYKL